MSSTAKWMLKSEIYSEKIRVFLHAGTRLFRMPRGLVSANSLQVELTAENEANRQLIAKTA